MFCTCYVTGQPVFLMVTKKYLKRFIINLHLNWEGVSR